MNDADECESIFYATENKLHFVARKTQWTLKTGDCIANEPANDRMNGATRDRKTIGGERELKRDEKGENELNDQDIRCLHKHGMDRKQESSILCCKCA